MTNSVEPQGADHSIAIGRAVGDDMRAIFGSGVRVTTEEPLSPARTESASARPRTRMVAIASAVLTTVVAAGIFAGANVGLQEPVAASDGARPRALSKRPPAATASEAPSFVVAAPSASVPDTAQIVGQVEQSAADVARAGVSRSQSDRVRLRRPMAPAIAVPTVAPTYAGAEVAATATVRDEITESYIASRVEVAERRAADAYEGAVAAGVRPRLLRDYRFEMNRARGEMPVRPQYAQRLYSMIASDLSRLADEADYGDGGMAR